MRLYEVQLNNGKAKQELAYQLVNIVSQTYIFWYVCETFFFKLEYHGSHPIETLSK